MKIMGVNMIYIFFTIMLIAASSKAKMNFLNNFPIVRDVINYISPKDLNLQRVRNLENVEPSNNVISVLDFIGLVERYGYPGEEHHVITEDGYNLTIHRIPGSPLSKSLYNQQKKKVMLIMHGIFGSSDNWVLYNADKDLGFLMADQGYDVWIGNFRGNTYSRSHVKLSPKDPDFWKFSYHEMGTKDLPAMIDYILNYTKHKTLYYIGFSMGVTSVTVLLSTRPEYNNKIKLGICLAPVVFWRDISPALRSTAQLAPKIKAFFDISGIHEVIPLSSVSVTLGREFCADKTVTQVICATIYFLIAGSDASQLNTTALPELLSYFPSGASVQTMHHYVQNIVTGRFESYDYGYDGHYEQYKQAPIRYDIKKITAPLALFYGDNDQLATKRAVLELYKQLPNVLVLEENSHKLFNHADFMWAIDVKTLVYDRVIEVMQKFNDKLDRLENR